MSSSIIVQLGARLILTLGEVRWCSLPWPSFETDSSLPPSVDRDTVGIVWLEQESLLQLVVEDGDFTGLFAGLFI